MDKRYESQRYNEAIINNIQASNEFNRYWQEYLWINSKVMDISLEEFFNVLRSLSALIK